MHEANSERDWIDKVNRAAIGHVNPERDFALIGDEAVATGEFFTRCLCKIDNRDLVAVNLFGGEQWPVSHSERAANFKMRGIEAA